MSLRRVLLVVGAIVLALPSAAMAQCGLFEPPVQCNERKLAQRRAEWEHAVEEQQELNRVRLQASENIGKARTRFWATYPDKPGAEQARTDFARWLWTKDIIYLRQNLQAPLLKNGRGQSSSIESAKALESLLSVPIDGGIPPVVTPEFEAWVSAVRKKVFEGHTSNSTDDAFMQGFLSTWMGQKFWSALASAEKEYQTYVLARDWAEFDHAQRVPAGFDRPETYGILLYTRFHHVPVQAAAANYKKMTDLLGAPRVQAAAKRVMDAPKRADGGLVVSVEAIKKGPGGGEVIDYDKPAPADPIGAFADPVRVMEMLATQDDDRRYLLDLLHRHAPDLRRLDPATTWTWAETAYKRLVLAFGEQELLAASHAVRVAPKRLATGGVMTVSALGVKRTEPIETVEDLLAMKDPRGYVKAALIFARDLDTASAVDAAYKTYVAAKGEAAVLDAARRRAVNKPQLTFKPELTVIEAEIATPTTAAPAQGPQQESPQYLAWKRFAPGASASYINRNLGQVSLRRSDLQGGTVGIRSRYLLRSITPERADLYLTEVAYDPPPRSTAHPPRDTEIAYPARLDATPTARDRAAARTPLQSGDETLVINGTSIATHWQAEQMPGAEQLARAGCGPTIVTTWRSDEVPGGLVRETVDSICRDQRYPGSDAIIRKVRETLLESFETSGPTTGTRPIQAVAALAPILPLPVPTALPADQSGGQPVTAVPPAPAAPTVDRRVFDRNMRGGPGSPSAASSAVTAPATPSGVGSAVTIPAGTVISVMTMGLISAATSRPGDTARGTIVQAVVVDGVSVIPGNTPVTLQVVAAGDGLSVQLVGITTSGGTIAAASSHVALDAQAADGNTAIERMIAAAAARPRGLATQRALAGRLVVVSGPGMNLPSGTRLGFTLAAPITTNGGGGAPAPARVTK